MRVRGCAGLRSVRWLAASCVGPWYPLAENRGEWGSLDRGSAGVKNYSMWASTPVNKAQKAEMRVRGIA
jgi:hypothetical protein